MPLRMSRPRPPRLISARPTRTAPTPTISPESRSVITTGQGIPVLRIYSLFGGRLARNGDLLQITFIGPYQIRNMTAAQQTFATASPSNFTEMNALTMDTLFADDQDSDEASTDNIPEQIGRFCPLDSGTVPVNDYKFDPSQYDYYNSAGVAGTAEYRYRFAYRLFDYLTVQAPGSDYKPNLDPGYSHLVVGNPKGVQNGSTYRPQKFRPTSSGQPNHSQVGANGQGVNGVQEQVIGVDGLVNINTAAVVGYCQPAPLAAGPCWSGPEQEWLPRQH